MYLWKTKELVLKMKNDELSQTEKFKYFLVFIILTTIFGGLSSYTSISPTFQSVIASILRAVIVIAGTILCYGTNKKGDDREFIDRIICISLPLGIKFFVVFIVTLLLYVILSAIIIGDAFDPQMATESLLLVFIFISYLVCFYWRLMHHLKIVSSK